MDRSCWGNSRFPTGASSSKNTRYAIAPAALETMLLSVAQREAALAKGHAFLGESFRSGRYVSPNMPGANVLASSIMSSQEGALAAMQKILGEGAHVVEGTHEDLGYKIADKDAKVFKLETKTGSMVVGIGVQWASTRASSRAAFGSRSR